MLKRTLIGLILCILTGGMLFTALAAYPIPEQLPEPEAKSPAPDKPVKVYILSGQSNIVGMGEIGPMGMTRFNTYLSADEGAEKGCALAIYRGAFEPGVNHDEREPAEMHHVMVGYWPHKSLPEFDGPCTQIARGRIRIDRRGIYSFRSGNILAIDGKVFSCNEPGKDPIIGRAMLDNKGNWTVRNDVLYKFGGNKMADKFRRIFDAQQAAADPDKHPDLAGGVVTVDTRPFWRGGELSPRSQDYHYNRNAETYYLVGDAPGRAMAELQERKARDLD